MRSHGGALEFLEYALLPSKLFLWHGPFSLSALSGCNGKLFIVRPFRAYLWIFCPCRFFFVWSYFLLYAYSSCVLLFFNI